MTKAAILQGDPECSDVVVYSIYDTKPVNFLLTACGNLKWMKKERRVYDKVKGMTVSMKFLCPEVTNDSNNGMNNVDITHQLRGSYHIDRWM